jgi:hypothetical protein
MFSLVASLLILLNALKQHTITDRRVSGIKMASVMLTKVCDGRVYLDNELFNRSVNDIKALGLRFIGSHAVYKLFVTAYLDCKTCSGIPISPM